MTLNNHIEPQSVDGLDEETVYTARLEFRSLGSGREVQPHFFYSHNFPDDYQGHYPAAFLALRDIAMILALETQRSINTDVDLDELTPDELAIASIEKARVNKPKAH